MVSEKEKLLIKSKAVKECSKHLIKKIKTEQSFLEREKADERAFGIFGDCGEFYRNAVTERESLIKVMVKQKISLEKFSKKLRHMAEKINEQTSV